jgi:hypothetical protein
VEAFAEIVLWRLWRWRPLLLLLLLLLAGVCGGIGMSCCLGIAQFDGCCERSGRWRSAPEWVAVGGFSCACRDLRLLCIVYPTL